MRNIRNLLQAICGKRLVSILPIAALTLLLNGCAVQRLYRFSPKSITRINYDPKNCEQMPDGRFKCKEVFFTVEAIDVSK